MLDIEREPAQRLAGVSIDGLLPKMSTHVHLLKLNVLYHANRRQQTLHDRTSVLIFTTMHYYLMENI